MRSVLVGADLMYRQDNKLVPIEINTNTAWDVDNRLESNLDDVFDFDSFKDFLDDHGIEEVWADGLMSSVLVGYFSPKGINIISKTSSELEEAEDRDDLLLLRTSYSDTAIVDAFCRDKNTFLNAIKGFSFGCEFILKTEEGLEGEITNFVDNGDYPNFIVKYRYPFYDHSEFPKLVKLENEEELEAFLESDEMPKDYLIMPFYYNSSKLYEDEDSVRMKYLRHLSMFALVDGSLKAVPVATYTKLCGNLTNIDLQYSELGVLDSVSREAFLDHWTRQAGGDILAEAGDLILMADSTWKPVEELVVGDEIKSLDIPAQGDVDIKHHVEDYNISFEELEDGSSFSTAAIESIFPNRKIATKVNLKFTDGSDWWDTENSSYPTIDPEDGTVWFRTLDMLNVGDRVILLVQAEDFEEPIFVEREIAEIETKRQVVEGYQLSVTGNHLFLSKTRGDDKSYVSIEHNDNFHQCYYGTSCSDTSKNSGGNPCTMDYLTTTISSSGYPSGTVAAFQLIDIVSWNGSVTYGWSYGQAPTSLIWWGGHSGGVCNGKTFRIDISGIRNEISGTAVGVPSKVRIYWAGRQSSYNDYTVGADNYLSVTSPASCYPSTIEFIY